ncbi:MAG: MerR family transcriptional regulator [Gemmatimonadaceae bacterium]
MSSDPDSFDINELAAAAGVTARTVRYYVQQGLLPSAGSRGPGARYDRGHVDRLLLIKRLQAQHLPLAEIRKRLEGLTASELSGALEQVADTRKSSAGDYIRHVLGGHPALTARKAPPASWPTVPQQSPTPLPVPPWKANEPVGSVLEVSPAASSEMLQAPAATGSASVHTEPETFGPAPAARSTWERVTFAADVELHLRRPLSREQNRLVERLLEFARHLFSEDA